MFVTCEKTAENCQTGYLSADLFTDRNRDQSELNIALRHFPGVSS